MINNLLKQKIPVQDEVIGKFNQIFKEKWINFLKYPPKHRHIRNMSQIIIYGRNYPNMKIRQDITRKGKKIPTSLQIQIQNFQ
jgi:hypothetical protein